MLILDGNATLQQRGDMAGIGTARVIFSIDRDGHVQNLKMVENTSNETFANICPAICYGSRTPSIPDEFLTSLPPEAWSRKFHLPYVRKLMTFSSIIAELPESLQSVTGFFSHGGIFMWPLLACSIAAVTTIILRSFALREKKTSALVIESEMERLVPGASAERLARIVHHDPSSLARIVRVALQHLRWPRSENVEAVQTRARHEMVRLEKGLVILEVVVGIAPLIGLIGTVSGLIHVFAGLGLSAGASGHETNRARHFRSAQHDDLRPGHRRACPGRVRLFLEESGSHVGGNGIARDRSSLQMLLRPRRGRSASAAPPGVAGTTGAADLS